MHNHDAAISEILNGRLLDIAIAKKAITHAHTPLERQYLSQVAVTTIYASLEGGIKDISAFFLRTIDCSLLTYNDLKPSFVHLALAEPCKLAQQINDGEKQVRTLMDILEILNSRPKLPNSIDTESNLTPKVFRRICRSLSFEEIPATQRDESDLNVLLRFRNNIAHGDRKMPIDLQRIDQFSNLVIELLFLFAEMVVDAISRRSWLTCG